MARDSDRTAPEHGLALHLGEDPVLEGGGDDMSAGVGVKVHGLLDKLEGKSSS